MDQSLLGRLRSQRDLMRRSAQGGAHIVYGYLRAKDSGTAKAGTPYYIGIGNSHTRPYEPHTRGGKTSRYHNVPVPKNEALVRQFGVFPSREAAAKREQELIARYGRKGLDDGGILLNRTLGGEGTLGYRHTEAAKQALSEKRKENPSIISVDARRRAADAAKKYQLERGAAAVQMAVVDYQELSKTRRRSMKAWLARNPGHTGYDYLATENKRQSLRVLSHNANQLAAGAERTKTPLKAYQDLTVKARKALQKWVRHNPGKTGLDWLDLRGDLIPA